MKTTTILAGAAFAALADSAGLAAADTTVECHSPDYKYDECRASGLKKPQLVHQISSSACIVNKTWGFNPKSGYVWVAEAGDDDSGE